MISGDQAATKSTSPKDILVSDEEEIGAFTETFRTSVADKQGGLDYFLQVLDQKDKDANDAVIEFQKTLMD